MNEAVFNLGMLEKDEIETADKILMVDIKMTDSKNLLDSKTLLF